MRRPQESGASFEETYPHYPFAALVRLAIAAGGWLGRAIARSQEQRARQALQTYVPRQRRRDAVRPPMGRILY